jgi:uncharacterized glyoxalase superfamily protein PhnB
MFLTEKTVKDMSGRITFQDPSDSTIILSVEVKNLDEVYTKLSQNGAVFIQEPKLTPWDQKVAYFKDTEGYTWEVAETPKS